MQIEQKTKFLTKHKQSLLTKLRSYQMKIAEALVRIKDIKGKLANIMVDINRDAFYEQIDANAQVPTVEVLIDDFCLITQELANIKTRITKTNTNNGLTLKIYRMEALRSMIKQLENLTKAKQKVVRMQRIDYEGPASMISTFATFNVEELGREVESYREEIRTLDLELQRLNWEIDLED